MSTPADRPRLDTSKLRDDDMLTVNQVADWLLMSPDWVRAHSNKNREPYLPSVKLGNQRRFPWRLLRERVNELMGL